MRYNTLYVGLRFETATGGLKARFACTRRNRGRHSRLALRAGFVCEDEQAPVTNPPLRGRAGHSSQRSSAPDGLGAGNSVRPPGAELQPAFRLRPWHSGKIMTNTDRARPRRADHLINFRCPSAMHEALMRAASRELSSTSSYIRRAVLAQLRADGVELDGLLQNWTPLGQPATKVLNHLHAHRTDAKAEVRQP